MNAKKIKAEELKKEMGKASGQEGLEILRSLVERLNK